MANKWIPEFIRPWLRVKIHWLLAKRKLPTAALKYIPYHYGDSVFHIPGKKCNLEHSDSGNEIDTCDKGYAVPPTSLRSGYSDDSQVFLDSGENDVKRMLELVEDSGFKIDDDSSILEVGASSGRMLRHFIKQAESCEVWGTDISAEHVLWAKEHLTPPLNFVTTTTIPHLPFEDNYFSFVFCGSVFTHIDDMADAWFLEIKRVLKPSGRFYFTIHDENTMKLLDTDESDSWLATTMKANPIYVKAKDNLGMLSVGRDNMSQVFYGIDYIRKTLNSMKFKIVSITEGAYGYQTGIVVEKVE